MKKKKVIDFAEYKKLALLFQAAVSHLEFCGYGDEYERECARDEKLPQRLEHMDIRTRQILQMNKED